MTYWKCPSTTSSYRISMMVLLIVAFWGAMAAAQNPIPQIVGPVKPMAVVPGSGAFTLTVYGANFVSGAVVTWNGQPRATTFISARELQAQILATDVAKKTAGLIGVTNPPPGGGNSSAGWAQVLVHAPVSTIKLSAPQQYPIGDWWLAAADFNNDGVLDLLGEYGSDVLYYPGKGDGTFHYKSLAGRNYLGSIPGAYGDFNGDGYLDIVFLQNVNQDTNQAQNMAVMLGDAQGTFHRSAQLRDETGFGETLVGDFNGDGKLDIVTNGPFRFALWTGNGDGTFQRFKDFPFDALAVEMVAGDFNGDGKLDIAMLQIGGPDGTVIHVALGNGDGTFQHPHLSHTFREQGGCGFAYHTIQVSDFNGDGNADLAICTNNQIIILLGNGDGTFQKPLSYESGSKQGQFSYGIGDINSDGKPDLLVSDYFDFNHPLFLVLFGNGDGTFQSAKVIASKIPFGELGIVTGDFNSDGLLDFVYPTGLGLLFFSQQ